MLSIIHNKVRWAFDRSDINKFYNKLIWFYNKRCETINFELRKSQKNVLKIMKKFLEKNERKSACVKKDQAESTSNKKVENKKNTSQVHASQTRNSLTNARRVMNYFLDEKGGYQKNFNDF